MMPSAIRDPRLVPPRESNRRESDSGNESEEEGELRVEDNGRKSSNYRQHLSVNRQHQGHPRFQPPPQAAAASTTISYQNHHKYQSPKPNHQSSQTSQGHPHFQPADKSRSTSIIYSKEGCDLPFEAKNSNSNGCIPSEKYDPFRKGGDYSTKVQQIQRYSNHQQIPAVEQLKSPPLSTSTCPGKDNIIDWDCRNSHDTAGHMLAKCVANGNHIDQKENNESNIVPMNVIPMAIEAMRKKISGSHYNGDDDDDDELFSDDENETKHHGNSNRSQNIAFGDPKLAKRNEYSAFENQRIVESLKAPATFESAINGDQSSVLPPQEPLRKQTPFPSISAPSTPASPPEHSQHNTYTSQSTNNDITGTDTSTAEPKPQSSSITPLQAPITPQSQTPFKPPISHDLPQPHLRDTEYTESLHWKKPTSLSMSKRPINLPSDVEHITEVEWAEDSVPTTSHGQHIPSHLTVTNLEKAPRPKSRRPEPCFCQPNLHSQEMCCIDESCCLYACQEECGANCPAGPLCGNKRIQRKEWKKLQVFDAGLKGRGLMVLEVCKKADFICEYVGVAVKRKFLDGLFARYKHERMLYIMALDGDVYIDARHRGGIARYINHSCEPNCAVHRWKVRGSIRAGVFALREIRAGEELSFDYQWDRKRGRALTKCYCGSESCRGTLEIPKDFEEQELEEQLEGHWIVPKRTDAGKEIMNRVIKIFFEDNQEYYVADVAQYDPETGTHQIFYRGDGENYWIDLSKETWMLLDEEGEKYAIARKKRVDYEDESLLPTAINSNMTSPRSDSMSRSSSPIPSHPGKKAKNYILIQTPVKDIMQSRHTIFKCGRYCRVHIDVIHLSVRDRHEGDDDELKDAMDRSLDGSVWKLVVTGMEPKKAIEYLEKMANIFQNSLNGEDTSLLDPSARAGITGDVSSDAARKTELIIPRVIVDHVKKRFFSLKGYCYNVDITFTHSDSKSKQFAKMTLSSESRSDMDKALEYLNGELTQMCLSENAPMTSIGVYKDFGYLGGELSNDDFHLLFGLKKTQTNSTDCSENLQESTFAKSFEEANRCSIWVQAEEDMGRVSQNRVINEASPYKPRKIFFGVAPSRVSILWAYIQNRIVDLRRGAEFLNLGADRIYQPTLLEPIKKNGRPGCWNYFFDFVRYTSGASVRIDSITRQHLRVDGGNTAAGGEAAAIAKKKIAIAKELIYLQIELLRDHHIRKQRWGFGRDWALLLESGAKELPHIDSSSPQDTSINPKTSVTNVLRVSDSRVIGGACLEISEIVASAGLSEPVAAHACIIFYRYINLPSTSNSMSTNSQLRDIQLASLFIANKSQKEMKWKRLESVLEHAYRVFYPGSFFNPESEEAQNWERRVINAEKSVLTALNYDVFWPGVDWVVSAVVGSGAMSEPLAENTLKLALSGHVLAAGPILWLKYGSKYAFAAIAGFLSINIEPLFTALSLAPLSVSHAAELIYNSCQVLSKAKRSTSSLSRHELFSDGQASSMGANIQKIQKDCSTYMSKCNGKVPSDSNFVSSPAYKAIAKRASIRKVFRGVRSETIEERILPIFGKICFESKCTIRFSEGIAEGTNDIVLEGGWKALSIAEHLVCLAAALPPPEPVEEQTQSSLAMSGSYAAMSGSYAALSEVCTTQDFHPSKDGNTIKQVKVQPGLLDMKEIYGKYGWEEDIVEFPCSGSSEIYDAGWKTCIAAKAPQEHLDSAGLRWWVPHQYGPSLSGSMCEIFSRPKLVTSGTVNMRAVALLAQSFTGGYSSLLKKFPNMAACLAPDYDAQNNGRSVAISLQRWPPEKIEIKEQGYADHRMQMGFSVAALQEMQLLHQLHFLIPSPQGHPNFILPLAIALDSTEGKDDEKDNSTAYATSNGEHAHFSSLLAMIEGNKRSAGKKQMTQGSHLVLEPTPIVLQKVINRYQRKSSDFTNIPATVLASWCHDMLSAISFCHSNHIILRSLLPDQIHIDHSGTAKFSGLSKVMILHANDRGKDFDPLKYVRSKKSKDQSEDVEPFAAPELVLGGTRYTKESDMWAFGSLLANLLLGKQLFPGRDRVSKMSATFKIVGVPEADNFKVAEEFPFYTDRMIIGGDGKKKRYKRGVEKALRHMLKTPNGSADDFFELISLIDDMLHLDPKRRITADKALRHPYMLNHEANMENDRFRRQYVKDWLTLKENILSKGSKTSKHYAFIETTCSTNQNQNLGSSADLKRKAYSIGNSFAGGEDELYNLEEIIGASSLKKSRFMEE
mmetsp:Transcript_29350/g.60883  ORF Transcript_29350/g.60883 Transcript_29350/m.60883 type:complete len:2232 (+) Transcript_29350:358-7053(+)